MKLTRNLIQHKIVETAREYVGVKYVHKGRGKGGIDCGGIVIKCINNTTNPEYTYLDYNPNPNPNHIKKELLTVADPVDTLEIGNILLISLHGLPQHLAIYSYENHIIHAYGAVGKVVEEKYTLYWKNKLDSIYRLRN